MKINIKIYYNLFKNYHTINGDFFMNNEYPYKGYDITNTNRLEKYTMEYQNPYGYNYESNRRKVINYEKKVTRTNQDLIKNGCFLKKNK